MFVAVARHALALVRFALVVVPAPARHRIARMVRVGRDRAANLAFRDVSHAVPLVCGITAFL